MTPRTAIIVVAETGSVDATEALARSLGPHIDKEDLYVLASSRVQLPSGTRVIRAAELNDSDFLISEILNEGDQCSFALPRLVSRLLDSYDACLYLGPGLLAVDSPQPLVDVAAVTGVGLFRPNAPWQPNSLTPNVRVLESLSAHVESRVVAVTSRGKGFVQDWHEVTHQAVLDVKQRSVSWVANTFLATALGRPDVTVGGRQVTRITDYGSGRWRSDEEKPSIVTCDELFGVVRLADDEEQFELHWQAATAKVDDTDVMDGVLAHILGTAHLFDKTRLETPLEVMRTNVRRALDPFGGKWDSGDSGEFNDWLFEANPAGTTRIANLLVMGHQDLFRRFADARYDPSELRNWLANGGIEELGFDPFDPDFEPFSPYMDDDTEEKAQPFNPVLWRWNVLKSLTPGYQRRLWYREQRKLVGQPSPREGKLEVPRAIPVELPAPLWGKSPRDLNVLGLFRSESGLGQASRATLEALRFLQRPYTHIDTSEMYPSRNTVSTGLTWETHGQSGDVNVIHANADEMITMGDTAFKHRFGAQFNVGIWFWETADLPERSRAAFARMDELWVASSYLQNVLGQYGRVPVHNIGLAAELPAERTVDRADLGWHEDELVFLFAYDALSSHGRKNPAATIRAFKRAFGPDYDGVRLVLKASNLGKFVRAKREIDDLISDCSAVQLIDRYLKRDEVLDLMAAADVYVSLHAAEGYGLTILESMALGTPAICTGYSGNMDFTDEANSWLVGYDLIKTTEPTGPYPTGSVWASPKVDQAADVMRQIRRDTTLVFEKAARAHRDAVEAASLERYAERLDRQLERVL